jgi:N,N'-diacetylchitobiose transport system permease protein
VSSIPAESPIAAESGRGPARRRSSRLRRVLRSSTPYLLILPVVLTVGAILGYPLYNLVRLSLERYGLPELIQHAGHWTGLVFVWSMPAVVAVQLWYWMTNFENGVLNYALGLGQHDWYASTTSQLGMVTSLIVWAAIPFVTITIYAGLAQVPHELVEAAEIDGARPWRIFRDVTFPVLKPIFLILTSLSIIWDFGVFTQPFLLIGQAKQVPGNYLMAIYLYEEGYAKSDFGRGAAISILMLVTVAAMSIFYVRRMVRVGEVT